MPELLKCVKEYLSGLIRGIIFTIVMGQVLRITHEDKDYSFEILNKEPLSRETSEIAVLVNGTQLTLVKSDRSWVPDNAGEEQKERGLAIGKAIALRYRI